MTTNPTKPTHEVYPGPHAGTHKGACRLCRYATAPVARHLAVARIEAHVHLVHHVTPKAVA